MLTDFLKDYLSIIIFHLKTFNDYSSRFVVLRVCSQRKEKLSLCLKALKSVAGVTGLEPATSCVTGRRSNQLSYTPTQNLMVGGKGLEPMTLSV